MIWRDEKDTADKPTATKPNPGGGKEEADPKWIRLAELFAVNDSFREKEGWHGDHSQYST